MEHRTTDLDLGKEGARSSGNTSSLHQRRSIPESRKRRLLPQTEFVGSGGCRSVWLAYGVSAMLAVLAVNELPEALPVTKPHAVNHSVQRLEAPPSPPSIQAPALFFQSSHHCWSVGRWDPRSWAAHSRWRQTSIDPPLLFALPNVSRFFLHRRRAPRSSFLHRILIRGCDRFGGSIGQLSFASPPALRLRHTRAFVGVEFPKPTTDELEAPPRHYPYHNPL